MDEANSLQQKAAGKRGDIERLAGQKADLIRAHEATIDGYNKQIEKLQADMGVVRSQLDRDTRAVDANIDQLNSEADRYEADAEDARQRAENLRKAAIAVSAASALDKE